MKGGFAKPVTKRLVGRVHRIGGSLYLGLAPEIAARASLHAGDLVKLTTIGEMVVAQRVPFDEWLSKAARQIESLTASDGHSEGQR